MTAGTYVPFAAVWTVAAAAVFRYSARNYRDALVVRLLGTFLIACSCAVFQLILCEVLQTGNADVRAKLWKLMTAVLLGSLGFIAPAVQIWRYIGSRHPRLRGVSFLIYIVYLLLFQVAGKQLPLERYQSPEAAARQGDYWYALRQDSLACISFVGITTMALLCGISSVSAPYTAFFADRTPVSEVDIARLQDSIRGIEDMIEAKSLQISRLRLEVVRKNGMSASSPSLGLMSRIVGMVRTGDDTQSQLRSLTLENEALEKLKAEVIGDLSSTQQRLAQQEHAKTPFGKLEKTIYSVFAMYCIYRVANSYLRMGWWLWYPQSDESPSGGPRDALVILISTWINRVFPDIDVMSWSRIIGVFMSGAVLAAALNGILRTIYKLLRTVRRSTASIPLDLLVVAQVVGVYVLSMATTLRLNLPKSMSGPIVAAIGSPLKVSSVQWWNDAVLSITSTIVLAAIVVVNRLNSDPMFDEEMAAGGLEKYE